MNPPWVERFVRDYRTAFDHRFGAGPVLPPGVSAQPVDVLLYDVLLAAQEHLARGASMMAVPEIIYVLSSKPTPKQEKRHAAWADFRKSVQAGIDRIAQEQREEFEAFTRRTAEAGVKGIKFRNPWPDPRSKLPKTAMGIHKALGRLSGMGLVTKRRFSQREVRFRAVPIEESTRFHALLTRRAVEQKPWWVTAPRFLKNPIVFAFERPPNVLGPSEDSRVWIRTMPLASHVVIVTTSEVGVEMLKDLLELETKRIRAKARAFQRKKRASTPK